MLARLAAQRAQALEHALASLGLELAVERPDLREDLVGDLLLLLAGRVLDARLPADRIAEEDRHLRELQPLPVAHLRGAGDRGGHDGRPRLEREPADAALGLLRELAGARAPALAVHDDAAALLEHDARGVEGLLV